MAMEKTQRKQSLNSLSNTPKLFDLNELLSSLKITPGQMENMKGLIYIEGLTEKQVRQKLSHAKIIRTNKFGVNSCLYYILFEDVKGRYPADRCKHLLAGKIYSCMGTPVAGCLIPLLYFRKKSVFRYFFLCLILVLCYRFGLV